MIFSLIPVYSGSHRVYFLPGQGADERSFSGIELPAGFESVTVDLPLPAQGADMATYAKQIAPMIDDSQPFSLVGVAMGGMLAVELGKILNPQRIIIISSAKKRQEIPLHLQILRFIPLHRLIPGKWFIKLGNLFRPFWEPESRRYNDLFTDMLTAKQPEFLSRAIHCVVTWTNRVVPKNVIHIHGTKDHCLPFRRVREVIPVPSGSHMLVLTRRQQINAILADILKTVSN